MFVKRFLSPTAAMALALVAASVLSGCTAQSTQEVYDPDATSAEAGKDYCDEFGGMSRDQVDQDGSSTVLPIAEAWAEAFGPCLNLAFVVKSSGTGGGFQKFCARETDISDASRPIKQSETDACTANGIAPFEVQVAIDGLAVVVAKENTFVDHLTVTELNKIWTATAGKQASRWNQLRSTWPDQPIELYGPGTDSGTFDYFIEVIIHPFDGTTSKGRNDYNPSEDDNILVQGVAGDPNALGYFGLAYVQANQDKIRAVPVKQDTKDGGKTTVPNAQPVEPTAQNVESGKYSPLARPLFMYTDEKPAGRLLEYFKLGVTVQGQMLVEEVGYIKLPAAKQAEVRALLE